MFSEISDILKGDLKRYYLYRFLSDIAASGNARFTMAYFFFNGVSALEIALVISVYGASCLLAVKPVAMITGRLGIHKTFLLHMIPLVIVYAIVWKIHDMGAEVSLWFYAWQFFHAWNVMLMRIPLTAYFSHYGRPELRGRELGLAGVIQRAAALAAPVIFGALVDETGLMLYYTLQTLILLGAAFSLGIRDDKHIKVDLRPYRFYRIVPGNVSKTFFFSRTSYIFTDDLFFIWVAVSFGGMMFAGVFTAARLGCEMLLSWWVGDRVDRGRVRSLFFGCVALSALFWLVVPFAANAVEIFALQFTVGLAGLIVDIPAEQQYHNRAKESGQELNYAVWKEICIHAGIVVSGVFAVLILSFVEDWRWGIMLGAPAMLAYLWMTPGMTPARGPGSARA